MQLQLNTMMDGAADALFQEALARLLDNVDDPNTAAKARRSITLTFTLEVDEDRRNAQMLVDCQTKLAPPKPLATRIVMGRHEGLMDARETLRQEEMFPTPQSRPQAVAAPGA